jgi:MHS family alpha-ketoglutarate permease-like MFS transporter
MTTTTSHYTGEERSKRIFAIVGASSGNLVEWFDFYVYAFCAIYFAPAFFPSDDPTVQLLNTAGVFAAGFLMRPIGGWIFGRLADKHGRKNSMMISVLMMCFGSDHRLPATYQASAPGPRRCCCWRGCSRACRWAANTAPPPPT